MPRDSRKAKRKPPQKRRRIAITPALVARLAAKVKPLAQAEQRRRSRRGAGFRENAKQRAHILEQMRKQIAEIAARLAQPYHSTLDITLRWNRRDDLPPFAYFIAALDAFCSIASEAQKQIEQQPPRLDTLRLACFTVLDYVMREHGIPARLVMAGDQSDSVRLLSLVLDHLGMHEYSRAYLRNALSQERQRLARAPRAAR